MGGGVDLGIETSCDDTCAALVTADGEIASNVIASQGLLHARYGGVVPEIASRRHLELVDAVIADALERAGAGLDELETVAVTQGPGLIGALLVGLSSAKALAATRRLPLVPVDHLHGHVTASTLGPDGIEPPYLCLVASGGHTFLARVDEPASYEVLGQTLDDAAGEAFDKGARLLGLGYPGGPELDRLAREGDPEAFAFPRSAPGELDFSFSGLKTALLYRLRDEPDADRADLAASYQRAIVEALTARTEAALEREGLERLAIGGGVAANSELRGGGGEAGRAGLGAADGAVHRQRGDDRRSGTLPGADRVPRLPRARRRGAPSSASPEANCTGVRQPSPAGLLQVEIALHPPPHLVGDLARVAHPHERLSLGVEQLVHQPDVSAAALLVLGPVAVPDRTEAPAAVVVQRAHSVEGVGPHPVLAVELRGPCDRRLRHPDARRHLLSFLGAVVLDAEHVDQRPERQPLADQRRQQDRVGQEDDQVPVREVRAAVGVER